MENTTERKITNVEYQESEEPKQIGNTPLYLIGKKLVIGKYLIADEMINEEHAFRWATENILEITPMIILSMMENQEKILEYATREERSTQEENSAGSAE